MGLERGDAAGTKRGGGSDDQSWRFITTFESHLWQSDIPLFLLCIIQPGI